jgi:hypothetical protein
MVMRMVSWGEPKEFLFGVWRWSICFNFDIWTCGTSRVFSSQ